MTAKQYLLQYKLLTAKIENLEQDLAELREARSSISINLDGMPHGTDLSDKTARLAAQLADMEEDILDLRSEAWRTRLRIIHVLSKVETPEHNVLLHKRYLEDKTWEQIAVEMHYTYQWVAGPLHGQALREIDKILDSN